VRRNRGLRAEVEAGDLQNRQQHCDPIPSLSEKSSIKAIAPAIRKRPTSNRA